MAILDDIGGKIDELSKKVKDAELGSKIGEIGNNVADALNIGARTVYGRAKNAAEVGGLKMKLADAAKEEANAFEKFGRKYMEIHKDDPDPALEGELAEVRAAVQKVAGLKEEIEKSRADMAAAEAEMKEKAQAAKEEKKAAEAAEDAGDDFSEEAEETSEEAKAPDAAEAAETPEEEKASEAAEAAETPEAEEKAAEEKDTEDKPEE